MRRQVTQTLWTCDHRTCKAKATSWGPDETPPGWTSLVGALQTPQGGGPASIDLCAKHAAGLHKMYHVHTDTEDEELD
jgi:hypothetical protein